MDIKYSDYTDLKRFSKLSDKPIGKCPMCGGYVMARMSSYNCNEVDCHFSIWKAIAGKMINKTHARQLLIFKETDRIRGFVGRNGAKFDAVLVLNNGKVEFRF